MDYRIQACLEYEDASGLHFSEAESNANSDYIDLKSAIKAFCDYVILGYSMAINRDTSCFEVFEEVHAVLLLLPRDSDDYDYILKHSKEYCSETQSFEEHSKESDINTEYVISNAEIEEAEEYEDVLAPIIEEREWASFLPEYSDSGELVFEVWSAGFIGEGLDLGFYQ